MRLHTPHTYFLMVDRVLRGYALPIRPRLCLTILAGGGGGLLTVGQAYLFSLIVQAVFLQGAGLAQVRGWLGWLLLVMVVRAGLVGVGDAAARRASLHEFIITLPAGYDTPIGERGWQLSGGERQRLALARAFLRQAPILLLDEPTANLDAQTAHQVMNELLDAAANHSVILITHYPVGLDRMDEVVRLNTSGFLREKAQSHSID